MKIKLIKTFCFFIYVSIFVGACVSTYLPTAIVNTPESTLFPQSNGWPVSCIFVDVVGLPVSTELQSSHILYVGTTVDNQGKIYAQGMKENTRKLVIEQLSQSTFSYGIGFFKDGNRFAVVSSSDIQTSDLSGLPLKRVDPLDIREEFPHVSPMWNFLTNPNSMDIQTGLTSPDGTKIAIWKLGDSNLVIRNIQTGKEIPVLDYENQGYINGSWSPDGTKFAITYSRPFAGQYSKLYIVNSDGGDIKELTKYETSSLGRPYWSPDSKKIIIYHGPKSYEMVFLETNAVKSFAITGVDETSDISKNSGITWSPDSNWIIYYTVERQIMDSEKQIYFYPRDLRALDLNTGQMYCLTQDLPMLNVSAVDWK